MIVLSNMDFKTRIKCCSFVRFTIHLVAYIHPNNKSAATKKHNKLYLYKSKALKCKEMSGILLYNIKIVLIRIWDKKFGHCWLVPCDQDLICV